MLELIKADIEMPPGIILFEDPPGHDVHRGLLSRVFTPAEDGRHRAQGPRVLRPQPRPARRLRRLRLHRRPRRPDADAHDRHAARHPRAGPGGDPRPDRRRPRARRGRRDARRRRLRRRLDQADAFGDYIDWRRRPPVRRPHDRAAQRRVRRRDRHRAARSPATRSSTYISLIAGAGNETTTRLIGWTGKAARRAPRPAARDRRGPLARAQRDRGDPPLRGARRRCRPAYVTSDVEHHGQTRRRRAASWCCSTASANRDDRQFPDGDRFDIHRDIGHHLTLRLRHPLLPRRRARPARGPGRARRGAPPLPRVGGRLGPRRAGPHLHGPRLGEASRSPPAPEEETTAMQMDDMILVSIDDHMIEPPDMYENHVPAKWQDQAPKVVRNDAGRRRVGVPGRGHLDPVRHGRHRRLAARGVGLQPRLLLRAAARLLRRARAGARHERQRRARVDELPDDGRLQRPHVHRGAATRSSRSSCSGRYNDWAIDEWCGAYPGRFIPLGIVPMWDVDLAVEEVHRVAKKGCRSISFLETPHVAGLPELPVRPLGPDVRRRSATTNMVLSLHIGAGFEVIKRPAGGADRPPHGARLPDQRHHRAGPAVRPDAAQVPRPQGGAVRGRHRLDPLLLRPHRPPLREPGVAARRRRLRRQAAVRGVPRAHPRLLHHRPVGPAAARPHRHRHHRLGVRLPPHRHDVAGVARVRLGASSRTPGAPTTRSTRSPGENACRFFDWDPFAAHRQGGGRPSARSAPVAADVDVTRMPQAEWKKQNEAAGIGVF